MDCICGFGLLSMILMGGYGALVGSAIDWGDAVQNASLIQMIRS